MNEKNDQSGLDNAGEIIERFGGIRPMASKMGVPVTTVQGWKKRDVIPANRRDEVAEAAQEHNIDIEDLLKASAANENATARMGGSTMGGTKDGDFSSTLTLANRQDDNKTRQRHEAAIAAGQATVAQDELIQTIRDAEKRAVKTSTWFSVILVAGVVILGGILLWPSHEQIQDNSQRINSMAGDVTEIRNQQGALSRLIPTDLEERFGRLQQQAGEIQSRIATVTSEAQMMADGLLDSSGGTLAERLSVLEARVNNIAGVSPDLSALIDKVQGLQQTVAGQEQLSSSVADLSALVNNMRGRMDEIDGALADAQGEDDALGQTLEGVSPTDLRAAAMLLGLAQFRSSLHRNAPFEEDLLLLKGLIGQDDPELNAAIDRLAPRAEEGVLTPEGLSNEFKGMAGDIVVSSLNGEDVSIKEKAMARFNDIMQVQKDGELVTGTDTQATVARAQKMLDDGDVQGALAELQSLDGEAKQTAQPFIEQAQATMLAEHVQEMVTGKVLNRLGSVAGSASGSITTRGGLEGVVESIEGLGGRRVIESPNSDIRIMPKGPSLPGQ